MAETKSNYVKFRLTDEQKKEIMRRALDYGFSSMSAYILWATLEEDHTEKGATALTASLEKIRADATATLEKVIEESRKVVSTAVDAAAARLDDAEARILETERRNSEKIEKALGRFETSAKATAHDARMKQKQDKKIWEDLLPMVGIGIAIVLVVYIFLRFFH